MPRRAPPKITAKAINEIVAGIIDNRIEAPRPRPLECAAGRVLSRSDRALREGRHPLHEADRRSRHRLWASCRDRELLARAGQAKGALGAPFFVSTDLPKREGAARLRVWVKDGSC